MTLQQLAMSLDLGFFFLPWRFDSIPDHGLPVRIFAITLTGHTTLGRTLPDEWSARRRPIPDSSQHSKETGVYAPGGIRIHNPSKRQAADPRLRLYGHWDRHNVELYLVKCKVVGKFGRGPLYSPKPLVVNPRMTVTGYFPNMKYGS